MASHNIIIDKNLGGKTYASFEFETFDTISMTLTKNYREVINFLHTIEYLKYDEEKECWMLPYEHYRNILSKLKEIRNVAIDAQTDMLPLFVIKAIRSPSDPIPNIDLCDSLGPLLYYQLKEHQIAAVLWGISKNGRCLIADEMGLGKTYEAIALAYYYKNDWPLLIVTTATMMKFWVDKIHDLLPEIDRNSVVCITSSNQTVNNSVKIIVTSYKMATRTVDFLIERRFNTIILDESHHVKTYNTERSRAVQDICKDSKRVILLSGTPALSRPKELYVQLSLIDPGFATFKEYSMRYCNAYGNEYGWNALGDSNLTELHLLLHKKFMIRRTKAQEVQGLPNKIRKYISLDTNMNDKVRGDMEFWNGQYLKYGKSDVFFSYYADTAEIKINAVCSYIKNMINETSEKFVVFAHHQIMLDAISNLLDDLNVEHVKICGQTSLGLRDDLVNRFQNDDDCKVAVLSFVTTSAGLTLTAAKMVIFAELTYTPGDMEQAESRVHRMGQTDDVTVKYLVAKGTADDNLWQMIVNKQQVLNAVGLIESDIAAASYSSYHPPENMADDENDSESNSENYSEIDSENNSAYGSDSDTENVSESDSGRDSNRDSDNEDNIRPVRRVTNKIISDDEESSDDAIISPQKYKRIRALSDSSDDEVLALKKGKILKPISSDIQIDEPLNDSTIGSDGDCQNEDQTAPHLSRLVVNLDDENI
uniref:CSON003224 protein n=1 Tax=Culicoides sonorensis TaxID=179676 RepID=A0A336K7I3_CULSO